MPKQTRRLTKKTRIAATTVLPASEEKLLPKQRLALPAPVLVTSLVVFLIVLAAAGVGSGFFFLYQYREATGEVLSASNQATPSDILQAVSRLLVIPNETPSVATVTDITKLTNQPFFAPAQNGDKVLVFQNAKEAVLYRPSVNKIVEVAPLVVSSPTPTIPIIRVSPTVGVAHKNQITPTL